MSTPDNSSHSYKQKSIKSAMSLFFQSGYSALLGLVANLAITILLSQKIYGMYLTVLSMITFLNYFSDIGLAASLIQRKDLSDDDIKTTFTTQQFLVVTLMAIGFFATHIVIPFYKLPIEGMYLYWALLAAFFISSLKTIPSVLLERHLQFQKLVLVQVVENTVFYASVVTLALMGYGLTSFTISVILRSLTGLVLLYSIAFWRPHFGFNKKSFHELIHFGLPFQGASMMALLKDDLLMLYLAKAIGFEALGLVGWAKKWADAPLRIVMDNISRVSFPLIARFQDDEAKLRRIAELIIENQTLLLAPVMVGAALTMHDVVLTIPKYLKWEAGVPLFAIFALSSLLLSISAPFMNVYNALGRARTTFIFMVVLTVSSWAATPFLIHINPQYGFPIAHLITSICLSPILILAHRSFHIHPVRAVYKPIVSASIMAFAIMFIRTLIHVGGPVGIGLNMAVGIPVYIGMLFYVFHLNIVAEFKKLYAAK